MENEWNYRRTNNSIMAKLRNIGMIFKYFNNYFNKSFT